MSEAGRQVARIAPAGSLLVACIAGSPSSIGRAAIANRDVAFNQQINALIPAEADVYFLHSLFRVGQRLVQAASTASMKGMVSKSRFEAITVPYPPVADQRAFAASAADVRRVMGQHQQALAEADLLAASLRAHAFSGQL